MLAEPPTAYKLWEAASVSGKLEPCPNTTSSSVISPVNKDCSFVLVFQDEAGAARRRRSTEIRAGESGPTMGSPASRHSYALVCERLIEVQAEITQFVQLADPRPDTEPDRPGDASSRHGSNTLHLQQSSSPQLQVSPVRASCNASRPSWIRKYTRPRAASGSAHHQPKKRLSKRPASKVRDM